MKALMIVLLSFGLTFGLAGCKKETPPEQPPTTEEGETTPEEGEAAPEEGTEAE